MVFHLPDRILLTLCKERRLLNPSELAQLLGATRMGVTKALKRLEQEGVVRKERFGKSFFFQFSLNDYTRKLLELLLMKEARQHARWRDEFAELAPHTLAVILFGSTVRDAARANDLDILLVLTKQQHRRVERLLSQKRDLLPKPLHTLKQTPEDFRKNLRKQDKVLVAALKHGIVLSGVENYVGLLSAEQGPVVPQQGLKKSAILTRRTRVLDTRKKYRKKLAITVTQ